MSTPKRNIIILFFLVMSIIPFMLMNDLFPFMRFGMFAETIKQSPQKEFFMVSVIKKDGSIESLSKRQSAMDDSHLNYMTRTYFYQHKLDYFVEQLLVSGLVHKDEYLRITQHSLINKTWTTNIIVNQK